MLNSDKLATLDVSMETISECTNLPISYCRDKRIVYKSITFGNLILVDTEYNRCVTGRAYDSSLYLYLTASTYYPTKEVTIFDVEDPKVRMWVTSFLRCPRMLQKTILPGLVIYQNPEYSVRYALFGL